MRERPRIRQWMVAAAGVFMIAAAVAMVARQRAPSAPAPLPPPDPAAIGLYVQHDGPALRVHWNPGAPARSGVLYIMDGGRQSRLDLSGKDLQSGLASYWPESRDVAFRLELDGAPAGAIHAPAGTDEGPRPSPFASEPKGRKPRTRSHNVAGAVETAGAEDLPKPHTVRSSVAPPPPIAPAVKAPPSERAWDFPVAPRPGRPGGDSPLPAAIRDTRASSAARAAEDPPPPKPASRWRRVTGKIPLLRRLKKH